jgi:hypothetical protein
LLTLLPCVALWSGCFTTMGAGAGATAGAFEGHAGRDALCGALIGLIADVRFIRQLDDLLHLR